MAENTNNTNIDFTSIYQHVLDFVKYIDDTLLKMKELGYTFFGEQSEQEKKEEYEVIVERVYSKQFPPNMYAYDIPVKETRTVKYSNDSSAIKALELLGLQIPEEITEVTTTINLYEIYPPVAIKKEQSIEQKAIMLKLPNTDMVFIKEYISQPVIYVKPMEFSFNVLLHLLSYKALMELEPLAMRMIGMLLGLPKEGFYLLTKYAKKLGIPQSTIDGIFNMYDEIKAVRHVLSSVFSSLNNMTGGASQLDPQSMLIILSQQTSEKREELMNMLIDKDNLIEIARKNVPEPVFEEVITSFTNTKYSSYGGITLSTTIKKKLTSSGKFIQESSSEQVSKGSVIQVIPLLRSKPFAINGDFPTFNIHKIESEEYNNPTYQYSVTSDKYFLNVSFPTTDVEFIKDMSDAFSKIITTSTHTEGCSRIGVDVISAIVNAPIGSVHWNSTTGKYTVHISCKAII